MKLENINNDKFKKLEKYQEDNLGDIKGGEESFTWWWHDTNMNSESNTTIDSPSGWISDSTRISVDGTDIKEDIQPYPED